MRHIDAQQISEGLAIVFDTNDQMSEEDAATAIKNSVVRRFGLQPRVVLPVRAERIPRTAVGKVQRGLLAQLVAAEEGGQPQGVPSALALARNSISLRSRLEIIWSDVLCVNRPVRDDDHFLDLGGDSLRALTLHLQIASWLGFTSRATCFSQIRHSTI